MFSYREEVYEYLCEKGVDPITAQNASELVRKGFGVSRPQRLRKELEGYTICEAFYEFAGRTRYLPKRDVAHTD